MTGVPAFSRFAGRREDTPVNSQAGVSHFPEYESGAQIRTTFESNPDLLFSTLPPLGRFVKTLTFSGPLGEVVGLFDVVQRPSYITTGLVPPPQSSDENRDEHEIGADRSEQS